MSVPRFFVENLQAGIVSLSEEESRHARDSRRIEPGEQIALFDGSGREGEGTILDATGKRRSMQVEVRAVLQRPHPSVELTLAVAVPKGPRQDWMIEKCTELGVRAIWPLLCERSVSGVSGHRLAKWRQIAIEAAKQSGQAWLPEFKEPVAFTRLLEDPGEFDRISIASGSADLRWSLPDDCRRLLVLIGPEGGWAQAELERASRRGAEPVSLGPNVLRIETAAVAVATLVHAAMRIDEDDSSTSLPK